MALALLAHLLGRIEAVAVVDGDVAAFFGEVVAYVLAETAGGVSVPMKHYWIVV